MYDASYMYCYCELQYFVRLYEKQQRPQRTSTRITSQKEGMAI